MLKQYIIDVTTQAINAAVKNGKLNQMKQEDVFTLNAETPKNEEFGDFAVNVSSLARYSKMAPPAIAQAVSEFIDVEDCQVNTVAGFINFKLGNSFKHNC